MLRISAFGGLDLRHQGEPVTGLASRKAEALLVYLACIGRPRTREVLAELLWEERPQRRAMSNLRVVLSSLRKRLGPYVDITRDTVALNPEADVWSDVAELEKGLSPAGPRRGALTASAVAAMEEAVALYRGDFLEGFYVRASRPFEDWAAAQREQLRRLVLDGLNELAVHYGKVGDYKAGIRHAARLLELDPLMEEAYRQMMRLLSGSGQRAAALAQYETCCRLLEEELGVGPAEETTALCEQIRDGTLEAPVSVPAMRRGASPQQPAFLDAAVERETVERPVFVARERELARLDGFLGEAIKGRGGVVLILGGAGRGKTALLSEFGRRALQTYPELLLASGNCNAYSGVGDPYLPFREVMAMLTGDVEARWAAGTITRDQALRLWRILPDVVQVLVDRGPELLDFFVPGSELVARAEAGAPAGMEGLDKLKTIIARKETGAGARAQRHLFEQYLNVLTGLASHCPVVILLDDLQWADAASIGLLFHLGRRIEASPILIVCTYRPDEVALGREGDRHPLEPVLSEFKRSFGDVGIDLAQADKAEGRAFIDAFLDTEPNRLTEGFRGPLFRRTEGHALFTVELLRTMQERGDLVWDKEGGWVEGPTLDWEMLPARVEGVIEERVGRLSPELRETLSVASVEGEEFTAQVVGRVRGVGERQLLGDLSQELERRHRLVREQAEIAVGDRSLWRYRFSHGLFQQYLYNGLGAGERRLLHREIARVLEELYAGRTEEIAVQLVRHYAGDAEREQHYARLAGEQAAAQFANADAVSYLSRALSLTPETDCDERYSLLLTREGVYDVQGAREVQAQDLTALDLLMGELGDGKGRSPEWKAELAMRQAEVALRWGNYAQVTSDFPGAVTAAQVAIDKAGEAVRLLTPDDPSDDPSGVFQAAQLEAIGLRAGGYLQWAQGLWRQGDFEGTRTQLDQALSLARLTGSRQLQADSLRILGNVFYYWGDFARARAHFEPSLSISREIGDRRGEISTLNNLGEIARSRGDYAGARTYYEQRLRVSREIGDRMSEDIALINLSLISHNDGDDESALEYAHQTLRLAQEIGAPSHRGYGLTNLGNALAGLGRPEESADAYREAVALRRELGEHFLAMESLAGLAGVALAQGDLSQALAHVEDILDFLEGNTLDGTEEPLRTYLTCYRVLQANQDPRAGAFLGTAHALLQERADSIGDEEMRRSFLEDVEAHREIVHEFVDLSTDSS